MEWLTEGQRVQKYRIEVWQGGQWKTVASSFAIGHKKIDCDSTAYQAKYCFELGRGPYSGASTVFSGWRR
jgi:alpha-L-fucosidase